MQIRQILSKNDSSVLIFYDYFDYVLDFHLEHADLIFNNFKIVSYLLSKLHEV